MDDDLKKLIENIKEKRKKDGYIVTHTFSEKFTPEEIVKRIIKSHT